METRGGTGSSAWSLTHKHSQRSVREVNDTFRSALALALKWEPGTCQGLNQHWARPSGAAHPGSGLGCPVLSSALAPPLSPAIFGLEVGREGEGRREGSSGHSACAERSRPRHHRGFPRSFQASNAGPRAAASAPYLVLPASLERYKTQVITKYCSSGPADASWVCRATDGRTAWQGSWTFRSPTYPLSLLVGSHNCQGDGSDGWGVRLARVNTSKRGRGHMDNL